MKMDYVGLLSGGKDSVINLYNCCQHGHRLLCVANLYSPHEDTSKSNDDELVHYYENDDVQNDHTNLKNSEKSNSEKEISKEEEDKFYEDYLIRHEKDFEYYDPTNEYLEDLIETSFTEDGEEKKIYSLESQNNEMHSYMYQTAGSNILKFQAKALNVPLIRKKIYGKLYDSSFNYDQGLNKDDEVEDLFIILYYLKKKFPTLKGVSAGAIASDYQRIRVENICKRLNLINMSYNWGEDRTKLIKKMLKNDIMEPYLIKVCSVGLSPLQHLNKSLNSLQDMLLLYNKKYGLDTCGEGGEYESIVLKSKFFQYDINLLKYIIKIEKKNQNVGNLIAKSIEYIKKNNENYNLLYTINNNNNFYYYYPLLKIYKKLLKYHNKIYQNYLYFDYNNNNINNNIFSSSLSTSSLSSISSNLSSTSSSTSFDETPTIYLTEKGYGSTSFIFPSASAISLSTSNEFLNILNQFDSAIQNLKKLLDENSLDFNDIYHINFYIKDTKFYKILKFKFNYLFSTVQPCKSFFIIDKSFNNSSLIYFNVLLLRNSYGKSSLNFSKYFELNNQIVNEYESYLKTKETLSYDSDSDEEDEIRFEQETEEVIVFEGDEKDSLLLTIEDEKIPSIPNDYKYSPSKITYENSSSNNSETKNDPFYRFALQSVSLTRWSPKINKNFSQLNEIFSNFLDFSDQYGIDSSTNLLLTLKNIKKDLIKKFSNNSIELKKSDIKNLLKFYEIKVLLILRNIQKILLYKNSTLKNYYSLTIFLNINKIKKELSDNNINNINNSLINFLFSRIKLLIQEIINSNFFIKVTDEEDYDSFYQKSYGGLFSAKDFQDEDDEYYDEDEENKIKEDNEEFLSDDEDDENLNQDDVKNYFSINSYEQVDFKEEINENNYINEIKSLLSKRIDINIVGCDNLFQNSDVKIDLNVFNEKYLTLINKEKIQTEEIQLKFNILNSYYNIYNEKFIKYAKNNFLLYNSSLNFQLNNSEIVSKELNVDKYLTVLIQQLIEQLLKTFDISSSSINNLLLKFKIFFIQPFNYNYLYNKINYLLTEHWPKNFLYPIIELFPSNCLEKNQYIKFHFTSINLDYFVEEESY